MKTAFLSLLASLCICLAPPLAPINPGLQNGLVAWWTLNSSSADFTGSGHPGTLAGAVYYTNGPVSGAIACPWPPNANNYISVGNMGSFPAQGTLVFWMNPVAAGSYENPLQTDDSNTGLRFEWGSGTGYFCAVIAYTGSSDLHYFFASGCPSNQWVHVACTWNVTANLMVGYTNGVQAFSEAQTHWPTALPKVRFGTGYTSGRPWAGFLDDVLLYNRVLSAAEVRQLSAAAQ